MSLDVREPKDLVVLPKGIGQLELSFLHKTTNNNNKPTTTTTNLKWLEALCVGSAVSWLKTTAPRGVGDDPG
jgi:hypothetical protein